MAPSHAKTVGLPIMNLVRTRAIPIIQQLHLEERLLRTSSDNWCIINDGTNTTTVVMGVSGKPSELIELKSILRDRIPVLRRFSGGGTVIVDKGTVFVTFVCNKDAIPGLQPYPHPIMSWTGQLYQKALRGVGDFSLRENDYVFGNRKFGGNAQSITRKRWIHHTSFLWDYDARNMEYLKHPSRAPKYRSVCSQFIVLLKCHGLMVIWETRRNSSCDISVSRNIPVHETFRQLLTRLKHDYYSKYLLAPIRYRRYGAEGHVIMLVARNHVDFLCPMKDYIASSSEFIERTIVSIQDHFSLSPVQFDAIADPSEEATGALSTRQLTEEELEAAMASPTGEEALAAA